MTKKVSSLFEVVVFEVVELWCLLFFLRLGLELELELELELLEEEEAEGG